MSDTLSRVENRKLPKNKIKIGIYIMNDEKKLLPLEEIKADQCKMSGEQVRRYKVKNGICFKEGRGNEVYEISKEMMWKIIENLHENFGYIRSLKLWVLWKNFITKNDVKIPNEITQIFRICQLPKDNNFKNRNVGKNIVEKYVWM